jgi:hypothetical protein
MQASRFLYLISFTLLVAACTKEEKIIENVNYDNTIFNINNQVIYSSAAEKNKQKNSTQYISILYADLYQSAIPSKSLNDIVQLNLAGGDKQVNNELVVFNALNSGAVIPTKAQMNADLDQFIDDTYVRFYLRKPTELERYYLTNIIQSDTAYSPEVIYTAFALSNEYLFY